MPLKDKAAYFALFSKLCMMITISSTQERVCSHLKQAHSTDINQCMYEAGIPACLHTASLTRNRSEGISP